MARLLGEREVGCLALLLGCEFDKPLCLDGEGIPFAEADDGTYTFTIPVEALDQVIPCAAYSKNKDAWYPRNILFDAATLPEGALK